MKHISQFFSFCLISATALTEWSSAHANTIYWGTSGSEVFRTSTSNPLSIDYQFEIGTFDTSGGWTPTAGNMLEWSSRWMVFDAAINADGWTPDNDVYSQAGYTPSIPLPTSGLSDSSYSNGTDLFEQNAMAYLWVFNSKNIVPSTEWALVADDPGAARTNVFGDWVFPLPTADPNVSVDWVINDLDTALYGTATLGVANALTIQTQVVPEPGSVLLFSLAGTAWMLRRRRTILASSPSLQQTPSIL
jgi:hypothetical protein